MTRQDRGRPPPGKARPEGAVPSEAANQSIENAVTITDRRNHHNAAQAYARRPSLREIRAGAALLAPRSSQ
jgi:hypothetical protein